MNSTLEQLIPMKDDVIKKGVSNMIFVAFSQTTSLILGITRTILLPLLLGKINYGYWQIYLLYLSYAGVFAFGYNDGIYLKYGRYDYDDLPKPLLRASIRVFILMQLIVAFLLICLSIFCVDDFRKFSLVTALFNIPIAGLFGVLVYILQVTNQLKKYSLYSIIDKLLLLCVIIVLFIFKIDEYRFIIIADIFSRAVVLLIMIVSCKSIFFGKSDKLNAGIRDVINNIKIGINVMIANFAGMLVLGFGRFLIERTSTVEIYSVYSFAIATINLVLVLISAIGLVVYPTMNRLNSDAYSKYFDQINKIIAILAFGLMSILFPLKMFISIFMVDFIDVLEYLQIVIAIIFVQSKMQIVVNPFYKLLRKERVMLRANVIGVILAVILITPLYMATKSVISVAVGSLIAMMIRLYYSENYLKKELKCAQSNNVFWEILGVIMFLIIGTIDSAIYSVLLYLAIYCVVLYFNKSFLINFGKVLFRR